MRKNKSWSLNADGSVTYVSKDGKLVATCEQPKSVVTIITAGNTELHEKLCALVVKEYGRCVEIERGKNAFGHDLVNFKARV